ncbi:hypothetical protein [Xanthomonas tesorieronis]
MSSRQRGIEGALAYLQQRVQARAALPDLAELALAARTQAGAVPVRRNAR